MTTTNNPTNSITSYRIQLAASTKPVDVKAAPYNSLRSIVCINEDAVYRVMTLHYRTLDEAKTAKADFRQKGFKDAFIIEYQNGKRTKSLY